MRKALKKYTIKSQLNTKTTVIEKLKNNKDMT